MKPPFPQPAGLTGTATGQQTAASAMVYTGQQHMSTRPPMNANAASASMQQAHGGQQFYQRSSGSTGGGAGGGGAPAGGQNVNQSQPRHVQQAQRSSGMGIPMGMIPQPPGGTQNSQQNYYSGPPTQQMYLPHSIGQAAHLIYQPTLTHQSSLSGPVEFQTHHEALSVPLIPSHSSSTRYTIQSQDNGDLGSPALRYGYPSPQYQQQPPPMYVQQPSTAYQVSSYPYQPVIGFNHQSARPPMVPSVPAPAAPYPKRTKNLIRIVDPVSQIDVTDDIMNNAGNNPTPPASGASSARGTPPSNIDAPTQGSAEDVPTVFARQVAVAVSAGSASSQSSAPPPDASSNNKPQFLAVPISSSSVPTTLSATTLVAPSAPSNSSNASRTKSEKEFVDSKSQENADLRGADKLSSVPKTSEDVSDGNNVSVTKEVKVVGVKSEVEVLPPVSVVKTVEKAEITIRPPVVTASTAPGTRAEIREAGPIGPPPTIKKLDSASSLPPPFTMAKNVGASEVNASVAPFGSLNPPVVNASDKMLGTPPGSSQVIISAPLDYTPARESVVEHGPSAHNLNQGTVGTKVTSSVVPAPFTQQQGPGQQTSSRPISVSQGVDSGRLTGHHPPATPMPFAQQQQQQQQPPPPPPSQTHKQNGDVQPDTTKPILGENEVSVKDGKHPSQSNAAPTNKREKSEGKDGEIGEKLIASQASSGAMIDEAPEVVVTEEIVQNNNVNSGTSVVEEESKASEELFDKETQRKNEENVKVTNMTLDKTANDAPITNNNAINHLSYNKDQWSPTNQEGKKQYSRDFLMQMQNLGPSRKKPEGLPDLEVIKDDIVNGVIVDRLPSANINKPRTGTVANDFVPTFISNNNKFRSSRNSQQGNRSNQQLPSKKISISLGQDIKLHDAECPWVPSHKMKDKTADCESEIEILYKKIRSLLNKLTPQNFANLVNRVHTYGIDSKDKLEGIIKLIFEKAIDEPNFSVAYANMCKTLQHIEVHHANEIVQFRKLIINYCQHEFERDPDKQKKIEYEECVDPEKKKQLKEELDEAIAKSKRRSLGNIRFIGELFKLKMLTNRIMHDCVKKLLDDGDDASLECLCRLLKTVGKDLENPVMGNGKAPPKGSPVAEYFQKIEEITKRPGLTSRIKFMLLDLIDLKKSNWVPRREDNNPKTIDQIHKEAAEAEQQEKQLFYMQSPMGKRNDDRLDKRGGPGMSGKRGGEEGWTSVSGGRKTSIPDTSKCRMRLDNLDENNIQFGPQTSGWSRGSIGGKSSHEGDRPSSGANRFSLLSDSSAADSRRSGVPPRQQLPSHSMPGRDSRSIGGSMSQQLSMSNHRSGGGGGGYKPSNSMSREHEQAIANVKSISNNDNIGRNPMSLQKPPQSGGGSRSSSVSREFDREPQVKEIDIEHLESKIRCTVEEYLSSSDVPEAVLSITEEVPVSKLSYFVTEVINQFLEKSSKARNQIGHLLSELVKRNKLTIDQFWIGMRNVFQDSSEFAIDIPKFWEYLSEIIAPLVLGEIVSLSALEQVARAELGDRTSTLFGKLLKVMNDASPKLTCELWKASGLGFIKLVPEGKIEEFVKYHKLEFLLDDHSSSVTFLSKEKIFDGLKQELLTVSKVDNNCAEAVSEREKIFNWIKANVSEKQQKDHSFIRALVTAIADRSVKLVKDGSYEFDGSVFNLCCTVIKRYVDNAAASELETLFALQSFVHKLEHPKGLLHSFFHVLCEDEVISDDGFLAWKNAEGQEVEGHAVAVKAVNNFLLNLKQSEDEDSA
ncbi:Eukaryotic translation initiation factor 4 gamma [Chamberlinius hualienensis]